ncbi:3D-(3,5/4)-trihydroxycyclohexane-1,2-dione acylhydrolase (decyclizing) [Clostridium ganghwense]|uniref:3D-(3,5/4)-trihydroxycyclohexane-1,2-dione acylhydrolase (Decyclizing) n=1 Tax=Clostridium ganghwense TaxID=312089 RepID=A0ABT4CT56_9CLOT|nr:3D-(3,5/4)-trihydroxycyclohexane-1,2-dione acylhydrolase (decyclizing) [Clostridium ganghwense]MCY6371381.1 3D-(3,5/4)-trihydroxycyclohexane-1,2-dione acylhydrolase (decyclizing) [Clostridium ganghwense]
METIRLSMAQALVKFLDNQYVELDGKENKFVKGVFSIFGHGNVVGLGQALEEDSGELTVYRGNNEQGMAHTAIAYAKQKNRREIIACTSSIGPGALNMVTAAGTATVNRIPLLLLPGDTFACRQPDPVLQQVEQFNDFNVTANDAFKPVSRYWDRISRPEQLMTAALHAMRVLTDPADTGAVTLCLPQDVQGEVYDYPVEFFKKRIHHIQRRKPTEWEIEKAVELVMRKKKPLIICGGGVVYSEAYAELKAFAEKFNIPFAETQAGKSALPWNHELNLGGMGVTGTLAANRIAKDADLIIGVGTRLSDFTTTSKWAFRNPDAEFLAINVNKFDAVKMDSEFLIADAREGLKALTEILQSKGYKSSYTSEIKEVKEEWNKEVDRLYSIELEEGLSQTRVLGELNKSLGDDAIVIGASGSLPGDLQRVWRPEKTKTYHMEYGFSCMGYEVAATLGAKMAEPDKETYCMVGDGSYLMLHSELVTSIQEGCKINILLFDNGGFQCIRNLQDGQGIGMFATELRYRSKETGRLTGEYVPIDFAANARSYGVKAYTVTTIEELKEAIENVKKDTVSTLIHIKVLPKTMTEGYESWWRVGVPEVAKKDSVIKANQDIKDHVKETRKY